jgi:hypothetical protein
VRQFDSPLTENRRFHGHVHETRVADRSTTMVILDKRHKKMKVSMKDILADQSKRTVRYRFVVLTNQMFQIFQNPNG